MVVCRICNASVTVPGPESCTSTSPPAMACSGIGCLVVPPLKELCHKI